MLLPHRQQMMMLSDHEIHCWDGKQEMGLDVFDLSLVYDKMLTMKMMIMVMVVMLVFGR